MPLVCSPGHGRSCRRCARRPCAGPPTYPRYAWRTILDPLFLALDSDRGESFRFIGTYGDSPLEGYQTGAKTLEHQLLFNYRQYSPSQIESLCANPMNEAGCPAPAPPNHISECPVRLASSPDWQNKAAHFVEKFCPGDVAYFNATLGLSY